MPESSTELGLSSLEDGLHVVDLPLCRPAPQLQVPLVARPRNHIDPRASPPDLYTLSRSALSTPRSGRVARSLALTRELVRREQDGVYEATVPCSARLQE